VNVRIGEMFARLSSGRILDDFGSETGTLLIREIIKTQLTSLDRTTLYNHFQVLPAIDYSTAHAFRLSCEAKRYRSSRHPQVTKGKRIDAVRQTWTANVQSLGESVPAQSEKFGDHEGDGRRRPCLKRIGARRVRRRISGKPLIARPRDVPRYGNQEQQSRVYPRIARVCETSPR
jgi:hypothetical protein